ncbi:hypothetical protein ACRDNQ_01275 [Palleronia sp. KMU-117]|uniref:hypothetical protein n=1 Tax=Palleronia sp. KMU-117 TaxID=3434108 RepID=UPI003D7487EF
MTDTASHCAEKAGPSRRRSNAASTLASRDTASDAGLDRAKSVAVSAQEISELVSGALQDAMLAAAQPCPGTYLDVLEGRKRNDVIAQMNGLPSIQLCHPVVQAEVLKEFAMMRAQSKLANGILDVIRGYARSKGRAAMVAMT